MFLILIALLFNSVQSEIVQVSIPEEVPLGTFVTKLMFNGEYSLYDVNEQYFSLSFDGTIRTKSRIDREVEPFNDPEDPYELKVRHSQNLIQVLINVIDINDNRPLFKMNQETYHISESKIVGYEFDERLPDAVDTDYGVNSTQGYRIRSGNTDNTFEIVSYSLAGSMKLYYLKVKRGLDRERTSEYDLEIEAYDGAYPSKKDTLHYTVIIDDENDCSPEFNQSQYFASVPEDARVGQTILTVKATDEDSGSNAQVVYSIDREFSGNNLFMINKYSGAITLQGALDYEEEHDIFLIVIATDGGSQPRSSKVYVNIKVVDVNDNQPQIEILYKSASDTEAQVDEDAAPDSPVVAIRVTDADDGEAGRVVCEMSSENGMDYFKLVHDDGVSDMWNVRVKQPPRREVAKEYTLSITARDNGSPEQKISFTSFKVIIKDINDHYPSFDPPSYSISILENTSPGTDIISVSATDADDGAFGDITYEIKSVSAQDTTSNPLTWFDITPKGGVIRNLIKLDREKTPDINIIVQAVDGGEPPEGPHIATASVQIKLLDENDNLPIFSQDEFEANIKNNAVIGTMVTTVRARDYDDGAFGSVNYDIAPTSDSTTSYFRIHQTTGQITVSTALPNDVDYLSVPLIVEATDGGGLVGTCKVTISIFGDNNYPPIFEQEEYTMSVNENVLPPKVLLTVFATDQDTAYFGEVFYELIGNTNSKFAIDRSSGELSVVRPLDFETTKMYKFYVRAFNHYDGTTERKDDTATVKIIVNDMNDEPPRFAYRRYNLTAFAEEENGTVIGTIQAVDPDSSNSGKVTYRIIGGNEQKLFKLVSTSEGAQIKINGNLGFMADKTVNLILEAQDDNEDSFNGDRTVLWISVQPGQRENMREVVTEKSWFDTYLPVIIGIIVFISLIFIVVIVVICNRANKQRIQYGASKLHYDGYEYADFDEQLGIEPDTVKAYNIDGGGECDRLSAFEALQNQIQSMQYDYLDKPSRNYNNCYEKKPKSGHIDSEGYFSLSDPAFNESPGEAHARGADYADKSMTLNSLLNHQNIYSNMPAKCDNKYVPGSELPPPDCQEFVRSLPPIDNNFLPMSPDFSGSGAFHDEDSPIEEDNMPAPTKNSLSSLISSQSRPSEITRLPTSLLAAGEPEAGGEPSSDIAFGANVRTSHLSLNSERSADFY